jgi:hypothetical protein
VTVSRLNALSAFAFWIVAFTLPAQAAGGDVAVSPERPLSPVATASANAVSLVGLGFNGGGGWFDINLALHGLDVILWPQPEFDAVLPIRPTWLCAVQDMTPFNWVPARNKNAPPENAEEGLAFCDGLNKAARTRPEVFSRSARSDLSVHDLISQPAAVRGQVVRLRGKLCRVLAVDVPASLEQLGIKKLYEGWVLDQNDATQPWCIYFTEIPRELYQTKENELDVPITFDGYFIKLLKYEADGGARKGEPGKTMKAPILLGRSPMVVNMNKAAEQDIWSEMLVPMLGGFTVAAVGILGLLTWSFRRDDRKVRARLVQRDVVIPETISGTLEPKRTLRVNVPPDWLQRDE